MSSSSSPYAASAQLLTQVWTQHKSLKTCAYDARGNLKCSKATYAICCHVLQQEQILRKVLQLVPLQGSTVRNPALLHVLLFELLLGPNKRIRGGGALKKQLMAKEEELKNALQKVQSEQQQVNRTTSATVVTTFPRYVRINTLQVAEPSMVIESLLRKNDNGQLVVGRNKDDDHDCQKICVDAHVPNLLVLPPGTTLNQEHGALVKKGRVVLQDKSSCFSALCLIHGNSSRAPMLQGDVLDACAAPGNKTSHLAALVAECKSSKSVPSTKNSSSSDSDSGRCRTIYALDRSSQRLASLKRRMEQLVPSSNSHKAVVQVVTQHLDFLKTDPSNYPHVRAILLDPSCSGSGIYTVPDRRHDHDFDQTAPNAAASSSRIQSLSNFQLVALKHAMSFPKVERIVYSTCSLFDEENECVVSRALQEQQQVNEENQNGHWHLVAPSCLQHWKRRGKVVNGLSVAQAQCLVRAHADDETNGFFVAYLERGGQRGRLSTMETNTCATGEGDVLVQRSQQIAAPIGIPVYNGEFASCSKEAATACAPMATDDVLFDKDDAPRAAGASATTSVSSNTAVAAAAAPPALSSSTPSSGERQQDKPMGKKRAKKLAWKRKQMEQKLRRIAKKNAANTEQDEAAPTDTNV